MIWITSDHHFNHKNILEYADRPFLNVEDMNEAMVRHWNEVVALDDIVWHLGDFTLEGQETARKFFRALNGTILVLNNPWHHDKRWINHGPYSSRTGNVSLSQPLQVLEFAEYGDGKYPLAVTLCHYPLAQWDRKHYGGICLHGHSHARYFGEGKILDVGVDSAYALLGALRPFSIEEVIEIMNKKEMSK